MGSYKDFESIFDDASKTYNVDKSLLLAVAKTESNFDPKATSSVGAKGIMQLMDGTAKGLGVKDSYDPYDNIMGGAKYLSQLLASYNGDTDKALASYFAGSGNVGKYGASKYSYYYEKVYKNQKEFTGLSTETVLIPTDKKDNEDRNVISTVLTYITLILVLVFGVYCIYQSVSSIGGTGANIGKAIKTVKKIKQGKVKEVVNEGKKAIESEVQGGE